MSTVSDEKKNEGSTLGTGLAWMGFWLGVGIAYAADVIAKAL